MNRGNVGERGRVFEMLFLCGIACVMLLCAAITWRNGHKGGGALGSKQVQSALTGYEMAQYLRDHEQRLRPTMEHFDWWIETYTELGDRPAFEALREVHGSESLVSTPAREEMSGS